jgi:hypothetical protein
MQHNIVLHVLGRSLARRQAEVPKWRREMADKSVSLESEITPSDQELTLVGFALDETGSMQSCWDQTIEGFNHYIEELKKSQSTINASLVKFDTSKIDVIFAKSELKDVPSLDKNNYKPGGGTNLYDAIGYTIELLEKQVQSCVNYPNVLCVILTDGGENGSKEYSKEAICKLIEKNQELGWTFVYLGANQDAWAVGGQLGFKQNNTMTYATTDAYETFGTLASATASYVSQGSQQTDDFFNQTTQGAV